MKESFKFSSLSKKGGKNLLRILINQINPKYKFCQALFNLQSKWDSILEKPFAIYLRYLQYFLKIQSRF